jgi:hypothetical protein
MSHLITTLRRWWAGFKKRAGDVVDLFKPRGYVEARLLYAHGPKKGQVYRTIYGRNIVTSFINPGGSPLSGRDMMRRILIPASFAGESLAGDANAVIGRIQLGSGTTAETASDGAPPATEILEIPLVPSTLKNVGDVELDTLNPYVTFIFEYDESEANATISEAALYSNNGDFIARKTFGSFTKTSDFTLQIRWQIRF